MDGVEASVRACGSPDFSRDRQHSRLLASPIAVDSDITHTGYSAEHLTASPPRTTRPTCGRLNPSRRATWATTPGGMTRSRRAPWPGEPRAETEQCPALGQLIYDLRTEAGLSQCKPAARMGTVQSVISRLEEGGGARNRIHRLARVATALGRHLMLSFRERVSTEKGRRSGRLTPAQVGAGDVWTRPNRVAVEVEAISVA